MSRFNKKGVKETLSENDKKTIYILSVILLTIVIMLSANYVNSVLKENKNESNFNNGGTSTATYSSDNKITDSKSLTEGEYKSSKGDNNAILVSGGTLTASNISVNKTGDSSSTENADFYGINAGIVVTKGSTNIKNSTINTNGKGANAVFATGENSKINISDSSITTKGESSSRGLDATNGGKINGNNLKITTNGNSSATLATDRGEGTVSVSNSTLKTNGTGSPIIYSTGKISINKVSGVANNSQMVVVEGKNSASVTNSNLKASGKGNRGEDNKTDSSGVMIYQSMSGDAGVGTGSFTAKDSSLEISSDSTYYKTAPMFFVTNTNAKINLTNTTLKYGSGVLLNICGTSEWGQNGSNGGTVKMYLYGEDIEGNIEVDKISTLSIKLTNSKLSTQINKDNTAKKISLTLSKSSTLTLTGDSYVTSLNDEDSSYSNINLNGYSLYVNGKKLDI